jgi:MFS family permease
VGLAFLYLGVGVVSRAREIPAAPDRSQQRGIAEAYRRMARLVWREPRLRWLVAGRIFRSFGFVFGTYVTAAFIERVQPSDEQMWIPVVLQTVPSIFAFLLAGWIVDRFGAKPALVLSSAVVAVNSFAINFCDTMTAFVVLFPLMSLGGSLLMVSWPNVLLKLAPPEGRTAAWAGVNLASAPGSMAVLLLSILLVQTTGFDYVFYVASAGSLLAVAVFLFRLPNVRVAPESPAADHGPH